MITVKLFRGYDPRKNSEEYRRINLKHRGVFTRSFNNVEELVKYLVTSPTIYIHQLQASSEQRRVISKKLRSLDLRINS